MVFHESLNEEREFSFKTPFLFIAILAGTTGVLEIATVLSPQPSYVSNPQAMVAALGNQPVGTVPAGTSAPAGADKDKCEAGHKYEVNVDSKGKAETKDVQTKVDCKAKDEKGNLVNISNAMCSKGKEGKGYGELKYKLSNGKTKDTLCYPGEDPKTAALAIAARDLGASPERSDLLKGLQETDSAELKRVNEALTALQEEKSKRLEECTSGADACVGPINYQQGLRKELSDTKSAIYEIERLGAGGDGAKGAGDVTNPTEQELFDAENAARLGNDVARVQPSSDSDARRASVDFEDSSQTVPESKPATTFDSRNADDAAPGPDRASPPLSSEDRKAWEELQDQAGIDTKGLPIANWNANDATPKAEPVISLDHPLVPQGDVRTDNQVLVRRDDGGVDIYTQTSDGRVVRYPYTKEDLANVGGSETVLMDAHRYKLEGSTGLPEGAIMTKDQSLVIGTQGERVVYTQTPDGTIKYNVFSEAEGLAAKDDTELMERARASAIGGAAPAATPAGSVFDTGAGALPWYQQGRPVVPGGDELRTGLFGSMLYTTPGAEYKDALGLPRVNNPYDTNQVKADGQLPYSNLFFEKSYTASPFWHGQEAVLDPKTGNYVYESTSKISDRYYGDTTLPVASADWPNTAPAVPPVVTAEPDPASSVPSGSGRYDELMAKGAAAEEGVGPGLTSAEQKELDGIKNNINSAPAKSDTTADSTRKPANCAGSTDPACFGITDPTPTRPDPSKPYYIQRTDENGKPVWCDQDGSCKPAAAFTPPPAQGGPVVARRPASGPAAPPDNSGNPGPASNAQPAGNGGGGAMGAISSLLSGLSKGLGGGQQAPQSQPPQTCSTDSNAYQQQQQQYQQALQQYNYQLQIYNQQRQQADIYGTSSPVPPSQPTACTPSTGNQCQSQPQQPPSSACASGAWRATYTGACVTGWQCISTQGPKAELSCEPKVADVGMTLAITYGCSSGVASSSSFTIGSQPGGSATVTVAAPPAGTNTATYTLACTDNGKTTGAQCSVQVARNNIILVANPKTLPANGTSLLSWLTTGMESCVVSSPDQADFTSRNSSNTSVTGAATTSPIATSARFQLDCKTLTGTNTQATTTVRVGQ